jgi:hypothetical protein
VFKGNRKLTAAALFAPHLIDAQKKLAAWRLENVLKEVSPVLQTHKAS